MCYESPRKKRESEKEAERLFEERNHQKLPMFNEKKNEYKHPRT